VTIFRLRYIKAYTDSRGKRRHYYRRPGFPVVGLPGEPGSREFMEAYHAAAERQPHSKIGEDKWPPKSVGTLVAAYYQTKAFKGLGERTQATYRRDLEKLRGKYGNMSVAAIRRKHVTAMLDAVPGNEKGLRRMLSILLGLAMEREWRSDNPMTGLRRSRKASAGFRTWTEEDIAKFEAKWPSGSKQRLALALLLHTGQRRSDVVRMGRQHVQGDKIRVVQQKTGAELSIALAAKLRAEIAAVPRDNLTFLTTAYGAPFSAAGFGNWFAKAAKAAGLPERSNSHGLRKAAARRLAEAGCSEKQIMAITGHKSLSEVTLYTAAANQERLAAEAVAKVEAGTKSSSAQRPARHSGKKTQ
jgi:integrase